MLAIRISRTFKELQEFLRHLSDHSEKLVVYQHDSDDEVTRDHVHALVVNPNISTDTMKYQIKKCLSVSVFNKSDWAFVTEQKTKQPIDLNFITYMSKGKLDPVYNKGFTQEELDSYKNAWLNHKIVDKAVFKLVKEETPEQRKKRIWELLEEVVKRVKLRTPITTEGGKCTTSESTSGIIETIHQVFTVENHCVVGRYKMRDYHDHVLSHTNHYSWRQQMSGICTFKE